MAFDTLRLEKGMYAVPGKTFTQVLEEYDPSSNYAGTELGEMDAFQRQLKRFDIKVAGASSDVLEKFFSTSDSAALFPEYVSRAVRQGVEENNLLSRIIATKTKIGGMDYRTIASVPTDSDKALSEVAEGATIPETSITTQENLVSLKKRGRMLVASYEALRFQRLDLFTVMLKQIGSYIATQQFADAVSVISSGDGNSNAAATVTPATSGTLTYSDLLNLMNEIDPYEMNAIIASPDVMLQMLAIDEFKDPMTGINFQGTGKLVNPLGADFIKSSHIGSKMLIGLDKRFALEMVVASDVSVEFDKLIDRQLERAAITSIAGFSKIFTDASAKVDIA